ncbi:hypothetical protein KY311_01570 [Candidatus Woesearchaeota archaeon]|nr:hypothetical protein [Candidatus Woesearchaeota archaeon]
MILVRYGEIALKGGNRGLFERKLVENIRLMLSRENIDAKVERTQGRILVDADSSAIPVLQRVFGIVSVSDAVEVELDFGKIKEKAVEIIKESNAKTFRISARRLVKNLEPSQDINIKLGAYIVEKLGLKVSLKEADVDLQIDIIDKAYLFTDVVQCLGGLPYGIEGSVVLLVDDAKASMQSGFLIMKRGCDIIPVALKEFDISLLQTYCPKNLELKILDKDEIVKFASENNAKAIVTSETIDSLHYNFDFPTLRPLIGILSS